MLNSVEFDLRAARIGCRAFSLARIARLAAAMASVTRRFRGTFSGCSSGSLTDSPFRKIMVAFRQSCEFLDVTGSFLGPISGLPPCVPPSRTIAWLKGSFETAIPTLPT